MFPIEFASHLKTKKNSITELELLAVLLSRKRFKPYLMIKELIIATDHKAMFLALDGSRSNKIYQSRLTW